MVDILFLAKGRDEFTTEALVALDHHTNWPLVDRFVAYTDGAVPADYLELGMDPRDAHLNTDKLGGPVAIMNHYIQQPSNTELFAKIDNDVIVPPGWLDAALEVMNQHPDLDFLGLEPPASRTRNPGGGRSPVTPEHGHAACSSHLHHFSHEKLHGPCCYAKCDAIGGVGLFRRSAFNGRQPMNPHGFNGVGGWTGWQLDHPELTKGWIVPPLKLFLLDRLPVEPWASLSKRYIEQGLQRPWTNYDPADAEQLWDWWGK